MSLDDHRPTTHHVITLTTSSPGLPRPSETGVDRGHGAGQDDLASWTHARGRRWGERRWRQLAAPSRSTCRVIQWATSSIIIRWSTGHFSTVRCGTTGSTKRGTEVDPTPWCSIASSTRRRPVSDSTEDRRRSDERRHFKQCTSRHLPASTATRPVVAIGTTSRPPRSTECHESLFQVNVRVCVGRRLSLPRASHVVSWSRGSVNDV